MATPRVLVVDDEPAVLGFVLRVLSRRGYEVQTASSPLQALEIAKTAPCFDLVLSDIIMPEMGGIELIRQISGICPASAVVLMSAHAGSVELPEGTRFIGKPFLPNDLCSVVDQVLDQLR